jgi:hypothetical protein
MNVTDRIPDLPDNSWVSRIEASRAAAGVAYAAFDRHRSDDMAPYVYMTSDYGNRWTNITGNLPSMNYVHVVREDPNNSAVIYAGTELGVYASWTSGEEWVPLRLGLPPVAVRDLLVHPRDNDLVIGTHGRGVWILDDIAVLQHMTAALEQPAYLFQPRQATRYQPWAARFRFDIGDGVFVGENPPYGALLTYYLEADVDPADSSAVGGDTTEAASDTTVTFTILSESGDTVRTLEGPGSAGVHRVAWNLRRDTLPGPDESKGEGSFRYGFTPPVVLPGSYQVHLRAGEFESAATVQVVLDPRVDVTNENLRAQHDALNRLWEMGGRGVQVVRVIDGLKPQLEGLAESLKRFDDTPEQMVELTEQIVQDLDTLRVELVRPEPGLGISTGAKWLDKVQSLASAVGRATYPPTSAQRHWIDELESELESLVARLEEIIEAKVPDLNRALNESGVPRIIGARMSR